MVLAPLGGMSNRREVRAYDYVNHPYEAVRDTLFAGPLAVFRKATMTALRDEPGGGAELRAKLGPITVTQEVAIEVVEIRAATSPTNQPATELVLEWKAMRQSGLFPTMRATLSVYPLSATETQLDLAGTYDPPLGMLGDVIDAISMHKVAQSSITGFIQEVAGFLRAPPPAAAPQE